MSPGREFRSQCHFWVIMKSQPSFLNCLGLTFQIYKMGRVTPDPRPLVRVRSKDLQHLKHSREQRSKEGGTGQGPPPPPPRTPGPSPWTPVMQAWPRHRQRRTRIVGSLLFSLSRGGRRLAVWKPELMEGRRSGEFGCGPLTLRAVPAPLPPQHWPAWGLARL